MTQYIDGIIHIADVPALVAFFAEHAPEKLDQDGASITGFTRTPTLVNGPAALTYVRVTPEERDAFAAMPGVTVLASAAYTGDDTADKVYDDLFANAQAMALYDAVYDRAPITVADPDTGGAFVYTPPDRFGQMG